MMMTLLNIKCSLKHLHNSFVCTYIKWIIFLQVLNKQALSLLKTLVGNDRVKEAAMKSGVSQLIVAAMTKHQVRLHTHAHCG